MAAYVAGYRLLVRRFILIAFPAVAERAGFPRSMANPQFDIFSFPILMRLLGARANCQFAQSLLSFFFIHFEGKVTTFTTILTQSFIDVVTLKFLVYLISINA